MKNSELIISIVNLYKHHKKYCFTFLLAGLATALIYFGLFAVSQKVLHVNHVIGVTIAYTIAAVFHFLVNREVTFKVSRHRNVGQIFKYFALLIINYVITVAILQISLFCNASAYLALLLAAGATAVTGYLLSKFWIFKIPVSIETREHLA